LRVLVIALLQQQQHQAVAGERHVHGFDRHRPIDGQRLQRQRKRHGASQRQDG
jgi:hypothetical protein